MIKEVRQEGEGAVHGECGCSSLRVREWMLTINWHGVEFSIAEGVEEIVRDPNPMPLFFFFFMCFVLFIIQVQRLRAALAMVKKNLREPTGTRENAIHPSLSGPRPTAHQPHKIINPTPTRGAE